MSHRTEEPYDTFTRVELTELIQLQELEISKLKEMDLDECRFGLCEVYPSHNQSDSCAVDSSQWSVAWSDLMMTMFIFFVVLYCYQISFHPPIWGEAPGRARATAVVGGERKVSTTSSDSLGPPAGLSLATMYKEGRVVLSDRNLGKFASLDLVNDKTMRVRLTGDLLFAEGRSDLLPRARYFLLDLLPLLRLAPYHIEVIGHADRSVMETQYVDGWDLSLQRASKVARILMDSGSLSANRFVISGAGAVQPLSFDQDIDGNAVNRRVEIILTLANNDDHVTVVKPLKSVLN
jgi:chemotaxis protein MotB